MQETTITIFPNGINSSGKENGKQIWTLDMNDVLLLDIV